MGNRRPLNEEEKEQVYEGKLNGQTFVEIAQELNCSWETARKWWKRWRNEGKAGIRQKRRGRGSSGVLSQFDPGVGEKAKQLKQKHRQWGANRVRIELCADRELQGLKIPSRSRLASYFKEACPECVTVYRIRPPVRKAKEKARQVHEEWQMDSQENIILGNGETAIISNLRDPFGAAPIASLAFSGKVTTRSRKLTFPEYRQLLRTGFSEFQTLPDRVSTDNELRFLGNPSSDFPGLLTLYLAGLGIVHVFIRPGRPTDHAQVERGHRTLDNLVFSEEDLQDLAHLQQALDRERQVYLHSFPSHASDCHGLPPLLAHPELLHPRRFYQPELEPLLFSIQRVFDFLATFTFERTVSHSGCVALTHQISIGRQYARTLPKRKVWIRCDPATQEWVFFQKLPPNSDQLVEFIRRPIHFLNFFSLTGLDPALLFPPLPVQIPLPFPLS